MREAVPILEQDADVFRYAWFSGDPIPEARLLSAGGGLKGTVAIAGEMKRLSGSPEVNLSAKVAPIESAWATWRLGRLEERWSQ